MSLPSATDSDSRRSSQRLCSASAVVNFFPASQTAAAVIVAASAAMMHPGTKRMLELEIKERRRAGERSDAKREQDPCGNEP